MNSNFLEKNSSQDDYIYILYIIYIYIYIYVCMYVCMYSPEDRWTLNQKPKNIDILVPYLSFSTSFWTVKLHIYIRL